MSRKRGYVDVGPGHVDVNSPSGPAPSSCNVDVERAVSSALARGSHIHVSRMPWELTPALRQVFSNESMPWLQPVKIPRSLPGLSEPIPLNKEKEIENRKVYVQQACRDHVSCESSERSSAVLRWVELLMLSPLSSTTGMHLVAERDKEVVRKDSFQIVSDTLRGKATSTINLRAASMALYCRWHAKAFVQGSPFPIKEQETYDYMCNLRESMCSASRGATFVSTLSFSHGLFGLQGALEASQSQRVKGASVDMYLEKRPLRQAPALHPAMVSILEISVFTLRDPFLRAVAGCCLLCLFGRLRISDMSRLVNASVIGKYVEGSLMRVKTMRSKEKQCAFLPMIVPTVGLLGMRWFNAFSRTRLSLGLQPIPTMASRSTDRDFVLMASGSSVDYEVKFKIGAAEVGECLRSVLGKILPRELVEGLSSHSLKTTLLTYASVYGLDYTESELLGYHLTSHRSAINYQRDALAQPIRNLMSMLNKIQTGEFAPCADRDEVFPQQSVPILEQLVAYTHMSVDEIAAAFMECSVDELDSVNMEAEQSELWELLCSQPEQFEDNVQPSMTRGTEPIVAEVLPPEEISSSDSETSDSGTSSVESGFATLTGRVSAGMIRNISENANIEALVRHKRTRMVHMQHIEDSLKTACGRMISAQFAEFLGDVERAWPHCRICFGTHNA